MSDSTANHTESDEAARDAEFAPSEAEPPASDVSRELEFLSQLMLEQLIQQATEMMREQAQAYRRLTSACEQLTGSLVRGTPETITSLVRAGEGELLHMRARLVRIMSSLTAYADKRAQAASVPNLSAESRAGFGQASQDLLQAARDFQRVRARAAALATNGSNFNSACIEMCGVQPTTYRAPYA